MADETSTPTPGTPVEPTAPASGVAGAVARENSAAVRSVHEQVVTDHAGRVGGRFAPGGAPWNKGRRVALAQGATSLAGSGDNGGVPADLSPTSAPVSAETVRRLLECGLTALDETLKTNFVLGWERVTGDRAFAEAQAENYALKDSQREAIGIAAALCAEKYAADLQFLPETALAIAVGGYAFPWLIGFNALRKAAKLKAREKVE